MARYKETILIVDDSKLNLTLLKNILDSDYNIITASDGASALELAFSKQPDLILLDIILPDVDGFEIIKKLKDSNELMSIPVIFITGLAKVIDEVKGLMLGAVDYIKKPFEPVIVKARVNNHIKLRRQQKLIEDIAMLDALTEIPNRRNYEEILEQKWQNAIDNDSLFAIGYFDIDFFKQYNDNYGHAQGDMALTSVASCVSKLVDENNNYVARIGGEEFAIIITGETQDDVLNDADMTRKTIENLSLEHKYSKTSNTLTVSIGGISIFPTYDNDIYEILEQVDSNLYKAKANGRNNVVWSMCKAD